MRMADRKSKVVTLYNHGEQKSIAEHTAHETLRGDHLSFCSYQPTIDI